MRIFILLLSLIGFYFFMQSGDFLQIEEAEYDAIIKPSESKKIQENGGRGEYDEARSGQHGESSKERKVK